MAFVWTYVLICTVHCTVVDRIILRLSEWNDGVCMDILICTVHCTVVDRIILRLSEWIDFI